eukprot:4048775-Amphidinium_carterae.2
MHPDRGRYGEFTVWANMVTVNSLLLWHNSKKEVHTHTHTQTGHYLLRPLTEILGLWALQCSRNWARSARTWAVHLVCT